MTSNRWILSVFVVLPLAHIAHARPAQGQGCAGCFGTGATATASNGAGQGTVKITLSVESGSCAWSLTEDPLLMACKSARGCATVVLREWNGLPPGSVVDFCIEVDEEDYCLKKLTLVDQDGAGESTRNGPILPCSAAAADQHTFKIRSDVAGLEAAATGQCSPCQGDL